MVFRCHGLDQLWQQQMPSMLTRDKSIWKPQSRCLVMDDALLLWNWWGKSRNVNPKGSTGLLWPSLSTQRPELERLLLRKAGIAVWEDTHGDGAMAQVVKCSLPKHRDLCLIWMHIQRRLSVVLLETMASSCPSGIFLTELIIFSSFPRLHHLLPLCPHCKVTAQCYKNRQGFFLGLSMY